MRSSTIVLTTALLASAGTSSWLWLELREARAQNEALREHRAAADRKPEPAAVPASPAAPVNAAAEEPARATNAVADATPTTKAPAPGMDYAEQQRRLMKNPEYRKALRNQQRQLIEFAFRDLPKVLGLTPEKAAAVFDLMAEQGINSLDRLGERPVDDVEAQALRRAYEEQQRKDDAEMEQLLGASGMERLQEFRKSLTSRNEVNSLRNELASSSDPLREDQVEPLVDIVYAEQQRLDQEMREAPAQSSFDGKRTELAVAANKRIVEAARPILSSSQLAALEELYRHQRLQMEAQTELSRLQVEAMTRDAQARKGN